MPRAPFENVVRYLFQACAMQGDCDLPDRDLLERFRVNRDESAFAFLVRRHGPIVFGVCRRLLGDSHEAEDAFQATFLVLVRRIGAIRWRKSIASWLYGVARRIASKARTRLAAQRHREREARPMQSQQPGDQLTTNELHTALDEAIGALPEKYRTPILLCYLEGKSYDTAAQYVGCSKASVSRRVAKALELLRRKLERRGIRFTAVALATSLSAMAAAAPLPVLLTIKTLKAATLMAAGTAVAGGVISANVMALVEEAMAGMVWIKNKAVLLVLAMGLVVGGASWAGFKGEAEQVAQVKPTSKPEAPARQEKNEAITSGSGSEKKPLLVVHGDPLGQAPSNASAVLTDRLGDLLPDGAIARLGTVRFKHTPAAGVAIESLVYSPNGSMAASLAASTGSVRLWDVASRNEIRGPWTSAIRHSAIAFSPNGEQLAVALHSGFGPPGIARDKNLRNTIILYDIAKAVEVKAFTGPSQLVSAIAFADGGKTLVGAGDGVVRWWDLATGKEQRAWEPFDATAMEDKFKTFTNCALAPDASAIALLVDWRGKEVRGVIRPLGDATPDSEVIGYQLPAGKEYWQSTGKGRRAGKGQFSLLTAAASPFLLERKRWSCGTARPASCSRIRSTLRHLSAIGPAV